MKRPFKYLILLVFLALAVGVSACGGGSSSSTTEAEAEPAATETEAEPAATEAEAEGTETEKPAESKSSGLIDPGHRVIGVIPSTLQSEFTAVDVEQFKETFKPFGWEVIVTDGQGNPQIEEQAFQKFIAQNVDAIFTIGQSGEEIQRGLEAAKEANIPVIAMFTDPTPPEVSSFAGVYADGVIQMGK